MQVVHIQLCWTERKVQCKHKEVDQRSQHFRCRSSKGSKNKRGKGHIVQQEILI